MWPSLGDKHLKSLPQPCKEVQGHLEGILLYQILEGLDSWGLPVGTSPQPCGLLAFWGGRAQLGEDQSKALYSVQPRVRPLFPRPKDWAGGFKALMRCPKEPQLHLIAVDRDVGARAPGQHLLDLSPHLWTNCFSVSLHFLIDEEKVLN